MPEVEMVESTEITAEEARGPGWNAAIAKKRKPRSQLHVPDRVAHAGAGTRVSRRTADPRGAMKRLATASRLPRLPREHVRIIVRPRDGLDVRKENHYAIMQAFVRAAGIAPEAAKADIICPNVVQNTLVNATPSEEMPKRTPSYSTFISRARARRWPHTLRPPTTQARESFVALTRASAQLNCTNFL
ncbi:hypothetical protein HPB48_024362 [Haemaphysalis longicornis]|uniref:Uncharacterized protein n=1 Tax=Haemaphysalis longicornis TaxID=44386 RepID=A0A9J6H914_HAELO|nr:hypothetical protein HPB48_024362 [Haemaphysalis longicornis]